MRPHLAVVLVLLARFPFIQSSNADVSCPLAADLDHSGLVDAPDLGVLLGAWGTCGPTCGGDLDGNLIVDAADLALLIGDWGVASGGPLPPAPLFAAPMLYGPYKVLDIDVADVDHNGLLDVVVLHSAAEVTIATHLQTSPRVFESTTTEFSPTSSSGSAALLDVTGDGFEDLVVSADVTRIFPNDGDGHFVTFPATSVNAQLAGLRSIDVDGDGDLDVLGKQLGGAPVLRLLRSSRGALTTEPFLSLTVSSFEVGDIDSDGDMDVVIAVGDALMAYRNDGLGSFVLASTSPGSGGKSLWLRDMNGDGLVDAISSDLFATTRVWLGDGLGHFPSSITSQPQVGHFVVLDLDGDGDLDVAGGNTGTFEIRTLLNLGDGRVSESGTPFECGLITNVYAAVDLDQDCRDDLLVGTHAGVAQLWGGDDTVLHNEPVQYGYGQSSVVLRDLDLDGHVDAMVQNGGLTPAVYFGSGGIPLEWNGQNLSMGIGGSSFVRLADINGDGLPDLVGAGNGKISSRRNLGNRQFSAATVISALTSAGDVLPMRWDLDTWDDILVKHQGGIAVYRSTGSGSFELATQIDQSHSAASAIDVDGDGDDDLVVGSTQGRIRILRNTGIELVAELPFGPSSFIAAPQSTVVDDFDVDGDFDIALIRSHAWSTNDSPGDLSMWFNDGSGQFSAGSLVPAPWKPRFALAVDYDVDGDLDVVASDAAAASLTFFENQGQGVMAHPHFVSAGGGGDFGAGYDLDGDSRPDFIVTRWGLSANKPSSVLSGTVGRRSR